MESRNNKIKWSYKAPLFVVVFLAVFVFAFTKWMVFNFGEVEFEQYWYGITGPTAGTPLSFYIQIGLAILAVIVISFLLTYIFLRIVKSLSTHKKYIKLITMGISFVLLVSSALYMNHALGISHYFNSPQKEFMQANYREPNSSLVKFPQKKKNLVYIYLESFESTYLSKELGGNVDYNLIPGLTGLLTEKNAINFSNTEKLGGGLPAPSTGYSIAGMFSQQSGLPFKVSTGNSYGEQAGSFVPGAITLGDILRHEGYNLQFAVGADGKFAGVNNFYQTHGDFDILDLTAAKEQGKIPKDYSVWWGFEDKKLFQFGKEYLDELSSKDAPFALILEADDSHFPNGYTDASCPSPYKEPYENSISCVDSMVVDFINYIKAQDYYEDTIIVVHGDHLSMEKNYFSTLAQDYTRTMFNAYLNLDLEDHKMQEIKTKNRSFYSMDVFPTILEAMNVSVKGHRLGLGTSLFSGEPTLYETYGYDEVTNALSGPSDWFTDTFLNKENKYK